MNQKKEEKTNFFCVQGRNMVLSPKEEISFK